LTDSVAVDAKRILLRYGAPIAILDKVSESHRIEFAREIAKTMLPERERRLRALLAEYGYTEPTAETTGKGRKAKAKLPAGGAQDGKAVAKGRNGKPKASTAKSGRAGPEEVRPKASKAKPGTAPPIRAKSGKAKPSQTKAAKPKASKARAAKLKAVRAKSPKAKRKAGKRSPGKK